MKELQSTRKPSTNNPNAKGSPFLLSLPVELHMDIADQLDPLARLHLRLLNHHFHQTFKKPSHAELLSVEQCPQAKEQHLYKCVHCLRLRDRSKFSYGMTHAKRSITGSQ